MNKEKELLVAHLSTEVELANHLLAEQRTKNNLYVAFGPFLGLGGLATNPSALKALKAATFSSLVVVSMIVIICYVGLGIVAA